MIQCVLCGKKEGITKRGKKIVFHEHHIDYDKNITIILCYTCHTSVHLRLRFGNPWESKYGKDKGFYELSKAFIRIYKRALAFERFI